MESSSREPGRFVSGVLKLAAGGAAGQAVMLIAMPVLSRLYAPGDFGVLAIFTGLVAFLVACASLRLEAAIPLPKEEQRAVELTFLSLFLVLSTSVISAFAVGRFGNALSQWVGSPDLLQCLWFLPVAVFGLGGVQAIGYWMARKKDFSSLGASRTVQLGGQAFAQLAAGAAGLGAAGLVLGFSAGPILGFLLLLSRSRLSTEGASFRNWGKLASSYRNFFLFMTWASLIDVASLQLAPLLLARFFSLDTAGYYSLAMRILSVPGLLIGAAVTQVFYPIAAEHGRKSDGAKNLLEQTASSMLLLSIAVFPLVAIHGPALFGAVFGPAWTTAGEFARWLSPWLMLAFIIAPLCAVILIEGHQRLVLAFSCLTAASCIVSIGIGAAAGSAVTAVAVWSALGVAINVAYLRKIFRIAGSSLGAWFGLVRDFAIPGAVLATVLFGLSLLLPPLASIGLSIAAMAGFLYRFRARIAGGVLHA